MDRTEQLKLRAKAYNLYKKDRENNATEPVNYGKFLDAEYQVTWYMEILLADEELVQLYHEDLESQTKEIEAVIIRKKTIAEGMLRLLCKTDEEYSKRKEVLNEVQDQIEVCEGFNSPVPQEIVKEWLQLKNAIQVQNKARAIKMSKLVKPRRAS